MPVAFEWFAYYIPKNAELRPDVQNTIIFVVKMLLVFGLLFQVPIVMIILVKIGIIDSKMLRENWRTAVVLASIVAAVATPSNDALTMMIAAVPIVILYFLGIFLVSITEQKSIRKLRS
jgi:sec-independent protein translocase protein TatC